MDDYVIFHEGGWGFWNETWSDFIGPFNSPEEAKHMLKCYFLWLDSGWLFEHVDG